MISVIIPVYNVEKYIARCLDSIINQTYQELEIIVVNDATPDNSMAIVEEYAAKDSRIRIVHNPRNVGLMMTRKSGYTVARCSYLMFVDSDDYLPQNAIEVLVEHANQSNADIVAGTIHYEKCNGNTEDWKCTLPFGNNTVGVYRALLTNKLTHNLCGKLFRTSLLTDYHYVSYDHMTNAEDACLFYQLVDKTAFIDTTSEVVYIYCQNEESAMNKKFSINQVQNILTFNTTLLPLIKKYPSLEKEFRHSITGSMVRLYLHGLPIRTVHNLIKSSGLGEYDKPQNIICTLSLHELLYYTKIWFFGFPQ